METNLLTGNIKEKLYKFTLPILLALFLQAAYGAADLLVVGQFGTTMDMSGVATGSQLMHSLTMVISCFATGATVLIGNKIGENKKREANEVIGTSIILFFAIGVFVTILMEIIAVPFCKIMNAPVEAFNETVNYVKICCGGLVFIIYYNLIGSICRGLGDAKTPLITVGISAFINVLLDLLLCAIFKMGSNGAAIATIMSQAISVVLSLIIIKYKKNKIFNFDIRKQDIRFRKDYDLGITVLGLPLALQEFLVGASFLIIIATVNNLGLNKSAGIGVAEKLCNFIMLVPSAFSQSISAFTAQNLGANKYGRAKKALFIGCLTSVIFACILFYLSFFQGETLARLFSKDLEVNKEAADYLKAYAIDTFFTSFLFCLIGFLNGMKKTTFVMVQGIVGAFGVRVPMCILMSNLKNTNLFLIGLSTPASSIIQIIICMICFIIVDKKYKELGKNTSFQEL